MEFVTVKQYQAELGIAYPTILRWINDGRIDVVHFGRERIVILDRGEDPPRQVSTGDTEDLIEVPSAARQLGLSVNRVYQFVNEGRLSVIRIGREIGLSRKELARFAATPRRPGQPGRPSFTHAAPSPS